MVLHTVRDAAVIGSIQDAAGEDQEVVAALDITFYDADGNEVEPEGEVKVTMTSPLIEETEETTVVHVDSEGEANVVHEVEDDGDTAVFTTDSFSIYAITGKIVVEYLSANGKTYEVTVTYGADAKIPEGASLKVTEFREESAAYTEARNAVLADKKARGEWVDLDAFNLAALDIAILDADGNEMEPAAAVQVDIKIKELPGVEDVSAVMDSVEIQHHVETDAGVIVETVYSGAEAEDTEPAAQSAPDSAAEASFQMEPGEAVAARDDSVPVDPGSVTEEDFAPPPAETAEPDDDDSLEVSFETGVFSTFTITWVASRGTSDSTTKIKWGGNKNFTDRGFVTVHYVVQNSGGEYTDITRPDDIADSVNVSVSRNGTTTVTISSDLAKDIDGFSYTKAYLRGGSNNRLITKVVVERDDNTANDSSYTVSFWNNDQLRNRASYSSNNSAGDIYLVYDKVGATSGTVTVHYVDENGIELTTAAVIDKTTDNTYPAYLIYDVNGYVYDHTYLNTSENLISPMLKKSSSNRLQYISTASGASWTALGSNENIYVVYKAKTTPKAGGTPKVEDITDVGRNKLPSALKESRDNEDGTRTISLTVTGPEKKLELQKMADVIVILDVSGSMDKTFDDTEGTKRIVAAKTAMNQLANGLLNWSEGDGNGGPEILNSTDQNNQFLKIRMGLIKFSNKAQLAMEDTDGNIHWVDNEEEGTEKGWTFFTSEEKGASGAAAAERFTKRYASNVTPDGGTNWEDALYKASTLQRLDSDRATYVIFVTDGNPTFRNTRGNYTDTNVTMYTYDDSYYYRKYGVFDTGLDSNTATVQRTYDFAKLEAKNIIDKNKFLFGIAINSAGAGKLEELLKYCNLKTDKNDDDNRYFTGDSTEDLVQSFSDIKTRIIATVNWSVTALTDGITTHTNLLGKATVAGLDSSTAFTYKRAVIPEGTTIEDDTLKETNLNYVEWDRTEKVDNVTQTAAEAVYDAESGDVTWNMGAGFKLQQNVAYRVEFDVWPDQSSYDSVAQIRNGKDISLPTDQYGMNTTGKYTLETNVYDHTEGGTKPTVTFQIDATITGLNETGGGNNTKETYSKELGTVDPLVLEETSIRIVKEWSNALDSRDPGQVKPQVKMDLVYDENPPSFHQFTLDRPNPYKDENGKYLDWKSGNIYISCGLMKVVATDDSGGRKLIVYESGHDFTLEETVDEETHYWSFSAPVYHPMVVTNPDALDLDGDPDGDEPETLKAKVRLLTLVEGDDIPAAMNSLDHPLDYTRSGNYFYYRIGGKVYRDPADSTTTMTGENRHRSVLDLMKTVVDQYGNPVSSDETFTFNMKLDIPEEYNTDALTGKDEKGSTVVLNDERYIMFTITDPNRPRKNADGSIQYDNDGNPRMGAYLEGADLSAAVEGVYMPQDIGADKSLNDSYRAVKTGVPFTLKLKQGWRVRVLNLVTGTTYSIQEVSLPEGYLFRDAVLTAGDAAATISDNTKAYDGAISEANRSYALTYTNEVIAYDVTILKTEQDGETPLPGARFDLYTQEAYAGEERGEPLLKDLLSANDGTFSLGGLAPGDYVLVETKAPSGYHLTDPVTISVDDTSGQAKDNVPLYVTYVQSINVKSSNNEGVAVTVTERENGQKVYAYTLTVTNYSGNALPSTGGFGEAVYRHAGLTLMMVTALLFAGKLAWDERNRCRARVRA